MKHPFESLRRRTFLDSCTAQTLRKYGGYIYLAEPIPASDRIHCVADGCAVRMDRVTRQHAGGAR